MLDTINSLLSIEKEEIDVRKRLQARRLPKSRLMSAITSALVCCSGASNPGATAAHVLSSTFAGRKAGQDCSTSAAEIDENIIADNFPYHSTLLPITCLATSTTGCVSCGDLVHESCQHLGFCPDCVLGTSVDLQIAKPAVEANIVEEEQLKWREIKKGTKPLLTAGRRTAIITNKNGLKSQLVSQALRTDAARKATSTRTVVPHTTLLYE